MKSGVSTLLTPGVGLMAAPPTHPLLHVADEPDLVVAYSETNEFTLPRAGNGWAASGIEFLAQQESDGHSFTLRAPEKRMLRVHLRWHLTMPNDLEFLGDDWERSYGNLCWRGLEPERIMPWYFLAAGRSITVGCGVKTNPAAFCFWQADPAGVSLWLDVRNGGRGVLAGERRLNLASIVSKAWPDIKPFEATRQFCKVLSPSPRLPATPVYGGNNWYYAYGKSSANDIRADSERVAALAPNQDNRPFMVIDDGWSPHATAGPWTQGNSKFPDMAALAADMKKASVRPGIWIRPLFTKGHVRETWRLHTPNAMKEYARRQAYTLDPTVAEVRAHIAADAQRMASWGFELVKHDFSTYDLFGRWGFDMGASLTDKGWGFADSTRTNAEIIREFYQTLRSAVGNTMLIGCNTVGHLSTGLFEMSRIGDDTSGRDWNRTRKMGVNTLAFRAPQHGAFFAIDADCAAITKSIPWSLSEQWLSLLARSGTPLFVSLAPDAVSAETRDAVKRAFEHASQPAAIAEPLDWQQSSEPQQWLLHGEKTNFQWFGPAGVSPFAT